MFSRYEADLAKQEPSNQSLGRTWRRLQVTRIETVRRRGGVQGFGLFKVWVQNLI